MPNESYNNITSESALKAARLAWEKLKHDPVRVHAKQRWSDGVAECVARKLLKRLRFDPVTGCLNYHGRIDSNGYGEIYIEKSRWRIHRVCFFLFVTDIDNGLCVLHKCDNRICAQPMHLFTGTKKDNTQDMLSKGRGIQPLGEKNGKSKLTASQVADIRRRYNRGSQGEDGARALAELYGVHRSNILNVIHDTWKHVRA